MQAHPLTSELITGHCMQVAVAQVDSHEFFRQLQAAKAVLVYLKSAPGLPSHQDLAASLQHQKPVDDWL